MKINQSENQLKNQQLNTFNRKRKIYIFFLFGCKQNPSHIVRIKKRIKNVIEFLNVTADILFWWDGHQLAATRSICSTELDFVFFTEDMKL